jgi:hypothetical protein
MAQVFLRESDNSRAQLEPGAAYRYGGVNHAFGRAG